MKIQVSIKYNHSSKGYLVGIEVPILRKSQPLISQIIFTIGVLISVYNFDKFDIRFKRVFKFDKLKEFEVNESKYDVYDISKEIVDFILNYEK